MNHAIFCTEITVRYAETDAMGITHHSNYAVWAEYARIEFLKFANFSYTHLENKGFMLPVTEINFRFLKPSYFDDVISIYVSLSHLSARKLGLSYQFYRNEECINKGSSTHIFIDKETRSAVKISPDFIEALSSKLRSET